MTLSMDSLQTETFELASLPNVGLEGKFSPKWPDGKKHSRSIYASTKTDCEEKLVGLIRQMKAEVAEAKRLAAEGKWEAAMTLATQKKARGTRKTELLT